MKALKKTSNRDAAPVTRKVEASKGIIYSIKFISQFSLSKIIIICSLAVMIITAGCWAPINAVYDNAKVLKENEVRFQGHFSNYYGSDYQGGLSLLNNNFGGSFAYGFTDNFNLKMRYERINLKRVSELIEEKVGMNYLELSSKIKFLENKIAMDCPLGFYLSEGEVMTTFGPRFFFTFRQNDSFEFNVIPKIRFFIADGVSFMPGISAGFGISNNLDKWALRPEIGYDRYLSFGIGLSVNIQSKL